MRRPAVLALTTALAVAAWGLVPLAGSSAVPRGSGSPGLDASTWCASSGGDACVQSATRNGVNVPSDDPTWDVTANTSSGGRIEWAVKKVGGGYDLGAASLTDTWTITILTTIVPRIAFAYGDLTTVSRAYVGEGTYRIVLTAKPVTLTDNSECNVSAWPWTCPEKATNQWDAYLSGEVTDYRSWADVDQRESMYGMNFSTNIGNTSIPPEITTNASTGEDQLLIRLANQHRHPDDTVFKGFVHLRIPNTFLKSVYGIDDPASMTSAGLTAGAGSGVTTVKQETGDGAMLVDATGITFSARQLKVDRGTIKPTKPTKVNAKRVSKSKAKVTYAKSKARGSKITGYQAKCTAGKHVRTATVKKGTKITVTTLKKNTRYTCKVRAKSKAGYSAWSKTDKIAKKKA